jgi:hypothetical protein
MAIAAVILILVVLAVMVLGRTIWRFFRGDVELEAGGSLGRQFFGRKKDEKPEDLI